uniref:Uncharacterized protein n=1 Tax=Brugia timori TaxID=42155 RepID=A0A0R3QHI8_9BILA
MTEIIHLHNYLVHNRQLLSHTAFCFPRDANHRAMTRTKFAWFGEHVKSHHNCTKFVKQLGHLDRNCRGNVICASNNATCFSSQQNSSLLPENLSSELILLTY